MKTGSLTGSACKWGPKNSFWSPWGPTWEQWLSPHPTPTTLPHPLFIVSLWTPVILAEPVGWVDFQEKKPRQNWSRGHFEATQKANFSILKPNFWSGDTAMGMAHWHNPKRVNFFSNILQNHYFVRWNSYFYQHFSGWLFFANFQTRISYFFTMGLSPCTAWVGDRYIGEVISPFRTLPWQKMTAQFQFFQSLPHKKADFVKKSRQNMGYIIATSASESPAIVDNKVQIAKTLLVMI